MDSRLRGNDKRWVDRNGGEAMESFSLPQPLGIPLQRHRDSFFFVLLFLFRTRGINRFTLQNRA
jgi:hypothetical protein